MRSDEVIGGMSVISDLIKEVGQSWLVLPTRMQPEDGLCRPGSGLSLDTQSADVFILNFSAPRTVRNNCLLLINHPVYGIFVRAAQMD